jgi:hypothetical protein
LLRFARNDDVFGWCLDLTSTHHALARMHGVALHRWRESTHILVIPKAINKAELHTFSYKSRARALFAQQVGADCTARAIRSLAMMQRTAHMLLGAPHGVEIVRRTIVGLGRCDAVPDRVGTCG